MFEAFCPAELTSFLWKSSPVSFYPLCCKNYFIGSLKVALRRINVINRLVIMANILSHLPLIRTLYLQTF